MKKAACMAQKSLTIFASARKEKDRRIDGRTDHFIANMAIM